MSRSPTLAARTSASALFKPSRAGRRNGKRTIRGTHLSCILRELGLVCYRNTIVGGSKVASLFLGLDSISPGSLLGGGFVSGDHAGEWLGIVMPTLISGIDDW